MYFTITTNDTVTFAETDAEVYQVTMYAHNPSDEWFAPDALDWDATSSTPEPVFQQYTWQALGNT